MLPPRSVVAFLALVACLIAPALAAAAPGAPDTRFGFGGAQSFTVGTGSGWGPTAAFPQADRSTLVLGTAGGAPVGPGEQDYASIGIVKLTPAGERDATYGPDGLRWLPRSAGVAFVDAVALPGGDLAVLGANATSNEQSGYLLSRVNPDGTLDASFGGDGTVETTYGAFTSAPCPLGERASCWSTGQALALAGSDHLVVAATYSTDYDWMDQAPAQRNRAVARYDLTGALDLDYGTQGTADLPALPSGLNNTGRLTDVAVEPSGRVLVLEHGNLDTYDERMVVSRLTDDGVPDATFGTGGIEIPRFQPDGDQTRLSEIAGSVLPLPGGDIAIGGQTWRMASSGPSTYKGAVLRLTPSGARETSFGAGGVVLTDRGRGMADLGQLVLVEGTLYAAGTFAPLDENGNREDWWRAWLARFDDDGLDTSFGQGGTALGGSQNVVSDAKPTVDGFLTLAGETGSGTYSWALSRLDLAESRQPLSTAAPTLDGSLDPTVGTEFTATDGTWHYADQLQGQWQRCPQWREAEAPAAAGCTDIAGATSTTYTVQEADRGKNVRYLVTATSGAYTATSATWTIGVPQSYTPTEFATDPQIAPTGSVPVGTTVHATWTTSGTAPATVQVRWFRCQSASGAPCEELTTDDQDDDAYTTTTADAERWLRAIVDVDGPGGFRSKQTANTTKVVAGSGASAPLATAAPTIAPAGTVVEGATLSRGTDGTWDRTGLTFGYRWERCAGTCVAIPGAGAATYTTTAADVGTSIRLRVDAREGDGPVGSAVSAGTAVTGRPAPLVPPTPPVDSGARGTTQVANPFGFTGRVVYQDSTSTKAMPDVRGLQVSAAKAKIEAAGIFASVDVQEVVRPKPLSLPGKPKLDVGDVSGQSIAPGTSVVSTVTTRKALKLTTEAGPKASASNGGASGPACTGAAVRDDLKKLGLGEVLDLLRAKGCSRVEVDFTQGSGQEVEVRKATKDGKDLLLSVTVPKDPKAMDLTPIFRQGAFNGRPSFGEKDWALTAGVMNIMGIQTVNRAGETVDGAEVYVDARSVDAPDIDGAARGGVFVTGFKPQKAGVVNVLVVQKDAAGNRVFGFGRFKVLDRSSAFTAIDGKRWTANGTAAGAGARAAIFDGLWAALGKLAGDLGLGGLFGGQPSEQTVSTATKRNVGMAQLSLGGNILSGGANVISAGGANVVAAGGANVVSAGGANVVSAGGANVIAAGGANVIAAGGGNVIAAGGGNVIAAGGGNLVTLAQANVVAAGGGNLIGKDVVKNGTGALINLPNAVIAAGGGNVIAAGGGNLISDNGLGVIAAGGMNMIAVTRG